MAIQDVLEAQRRCGCYGGSRRDSSEGMIRRIRLKGRSGGPGGKGMWWLRKDRMIPK
jgi:hypothetical protein